MASIADFENMMTFDQPIKSTKQCRWERKRSEQGLSDRFIPSRSAMNSSSSFGEDMTDDESCEASEFSKILSENLVDSSKTRILSYKQKAPAASEEYQSSMKVLYSQNSGKKIETIKSTRHISSAPARILDAPGMRNDYCKHSDNLTFYPKIIDIFAI